MKASPRNASAQASEVPINILIVDDEPKNLRVLEAILDEPGYRLVQAESGDQALLALMAQEFALLILDVRMPGLSGIELAQMVKLRKKTAQVPIIFLSAYFSEDQQVVYKDNTGAVDFLEKPVNPIILRSKVAVFADLYRKSFLIKEANTALTIETAKLLRALEDKEVLMREIHHRVRNNLQIVTNILSLQGLSFTDPKIRGAFQECEGRIYAISLIHQHLYQSTSLARVDLSDYTQTLLTSIQASCAVPDLVRVESHLQPVKVGLDAAVTIGLILNELLTNCFKHAFPNQQKGVVQVKLSEDEGQIRIRVQDDGKGFMPGYQLEQAMLSSKSLGLRLLKIFAEQLDATLELNSQPSCTAFDICFRG